MTLRTVGIRLTAEVAGYMTGLQRAAATTKDFNGELNRSAKAGNLDAVADRAGIAGLALAGMAGYAIKAAADFDKSMSAVKAATHASGDEINQLRAAALQAGKDTQYSATGAADAITELSKAGVSVADVLGGGLKGALSLAAAGQLDVGEAAETAASAMSQFSLKGKDIPHIADLLAAGAGKAQGSVHDMGAALNQSGLVASQFGLSIEDTAGALAEFAHAGLLGSDAGTSLKTMLLAIANPSSVSAKLMHSLGVEFYDAQGKFIGLNGVAAVLQKRLGGLTDAQRQQALGQIFGNDAIRAASILYKDGAAGVDEWKGAVNQAGYASDTAADLTNNLSGDLERLKGSLETLAIQSGSGANGGLRFLVKSLDAMVGQFMAMPPAVGGTLTVLAAVGGAALLALAAFIKLRKGLAEAVEQLSLMGPAGEKAATGLQRVAGAAGKAGLAFIAMEAASAVLNSLDEKTANVDKLTASLTTLADTGKATGEINNAFGDNFKNLDNIAFFADNANHGLGKFLNTTLGGIPAVGDLGKALGGLGTRLIAGTDFDTATQQMASLDQALTNYMTTTNDAKKASDLWNQVLVKSGMDTQQLAQLLPGAYKEVGVLNTAADKGGTALGGMAKGANKAAGATGDLNSALDKGKAAQDEYKTIADSTAGAMRGETDAFISLSKQLRAQVDPVFGLIDAQNTLATAHDKASKAVKEHGRNSKEARAADRELALAAIDLQGKVGAAAGTFSGKLDPALVATLRAGGLTESQIKDVSKQFDAAKKSADKYTGKYEAKASAPGAKDAKKQLDDAYTAANHFAGPYQAKASAPGAKDAKKQLDDAYTAANHFAGPYKATVDVKGNEVAEAQLRRLSIYQQALKSGKIPVGFNGPIKGPDGKYYADGGWTGPGSKWDPAGVVHADEFVIKKESRRKIEAASPGLLDEMNATGQAPGYLAGGRVTSWPYSTAAGMTKIPSQATVASVVVGNFGDWPSSPSAQRGDSGVWRKVVALIRSTGPLSGSFGNAYRPGDPLWHGSGRAVDWMGFNQDRLATFLAGRRPLELIHRTRQRDYAYTRGVNKGSFHNALMEAHRNHVHIAMARGGTIAEPIFGVGASGRTYSFGENYQSERVTPNWQAGSGERGATNINITVTAPVGSHPREIGNTVLEYVQAALEGGSEVRVRGQRVL